MTIGLTYDEMIALQPCGERAKAVAELLGGAKKWNGKKIDAAKAVKAGVTFDDLVWAASAVARKDADVERRLRLWLADCAARVLHIYERDCPKDMRPRSAIIAGRAFARGEITAAARAAARAAAWAAARAAARAAAWAAARAAAWAAAWADEQKWQFDRLVVWLSKDEPNDWPLPSSNSALDDESNTAAVRA